MPEHTLSELQKRLVQQMQLQGAQGANPLTPSSMGPTFSPGTGTEEVSKRVGATMGLDAMLSDPAVMSPILAAGVRFLIPKTRLSSLQSNIPILEGIESPGQSDLFRMGREMEKARPGTPQHIRGVLDRDTGRLVVGRSDQVIHDDLLSGFKAPPKHLYLLGFEVLPKEQKIRLRHIDTVDYSPATRMMTEAGEPLNSKQVRTILEEYPELSQVLRRGSE